MLLNRNPSGMAATAPDFPCLSTVRQLRQHLRLARTPGKAHRLGSLALLLHLPLVRLPRLRCLPQYCPPGRGSSSPCATHGQGFPSICAEQLCSTRFLYGNVGDATVSIADPSGPPDSLRQSLLQWLVCLCSPSLFVCHPDHASVVRLNGEKVTDSITFE